MLLVHLPKASLQRYKANQHYAHILSHAAKPEPQITPKLAQLIKAKDWPAAS